MDEVALIRDAQGGDLDSFNRLVLAYQELAYNLALRMLDDEASAEDATQTAFISAYRHMESFRGGSFKSWVMRMVTNTCYDELRRQKRRPTTPLEPINDEDDEEIESPYWMADDHNPTPEQALDQRELESAIQSCLSDLPDDFRSVVIMVDVEGLDYQEVSDAIGKPLGTVKSRLARAREKMRDCLQGAWELLPANFRLKLEERA
ncbi:MAG TPA: sigma-70 family RNA polymerase sigma factor [Longilinea sp.]|nr:sigma-70 family RNA polymerase sigma factor [Longilinea sp.]